MTVLNAASITLQHAHGYLIWCVAERIRQQTWDKAIAGDSMMLSGSRSCFSIEAVDEEIMRRVNEFDISPTAPLCGRGEPMVPPKQAEIESRHPQTTGKAG